MEIAEENTGMAQSDLKFIILLLHVALKCIPVSTPFPPPPKLFVWNPSRRYSNRIYPPYINLPIRRQL